MGEECPPANRASALNGMYFAFASVVAFMVACVVLALRSGGGEDPVQETAAREGKDEMAALEMADLKDLDSN